MSARDKSANFAKLAKQAERYDEMADHMEVVGKFPDELSVVEHNLLSVAYTIAVGSWRATWRIITSVEQKEKSKGNEGPCGFAKEYCQKVEHELQKICDAILDLRESNLIMSRALTIMYGSQVFTVVRTVIEPSTCVQVAERFTSGKYTKMLATAGVCGLTCASSRG